MAVRFPQIINIPDFTPLRLDRHQLHVLVASLDTLGKNRDQTLAVISSEEQARAERYVNPTHGNNFRLVRGTLRILLAGYLQMPADDIHFFNNQYGKPAVASAQNHLAIQFNLSHSSHMAAFVFSVGGRVGIDIEYMKALNDISGMARHVCSVRELEEFTALDPSRQQSAFFRLWTRKEAFIKAKGQGLSMGLRSIHIGFGETEPINFIEYRGDRLDNWLVKDLPCDENYKLAVAIETKLGEAS